MMLAMGPSMRILITGANGQVGHELLRALRGQRGAADALHASQGMGGQGWREEAPTLIAATRSGRLGDDSTCEAIDLADPDGLTVALDRIAPDLILNAAAYTAVDRAEDEPELAQRINGDAPGAIGRWSARHGARVVHYSTDYVFAGTATQPYREDDPTHPVSVYGRSKLAGEVALRDSGARHLIFRTAWVYAARGHNFLRTMLRLGAERDELRVVDDQVGAPTPARLIADVTARALAQWLDDAASARDGVYHLVASGRTSWCGFARAIFERAQRAGLIERAPSVQAIGTADYPTRATRPAFSVLDTTRLRAALGIDLPDWQTALDDVIRELAEARS
jgi:dTDP-4-dehydrorhamnose reductase